jgi:hypothetical protein
MRKTGMFAAALVLVVAGGAQAQETADVVATYTIPAVSNIVFSGAPDFVFVVPSAGAGFATQSDASSYAVSTNASNATIQAQVDGLESGVALRVSLTAPTGASSTGSQALNATTPVDLVTGIANLNESLLAVAWAMDADMTTPRGAGSITVTFTIVEN